MPNRVGIVLVKSLTYGTSGIDDDDELRPGFDGDVEVRGRDDAAVDELAVSHAVGGVDHRQRGRGADGGADRDVVPALGAEHDPLAGVEVGGGQVELVLEQAEVVGAAVLRQRLAHVVLDALAGVDAGRERVTQRKNEIDGRERGERARDVAGDADRVQRQLQGLQGELGLVQAQQHLAIQRRQNVRHLVVDRAHHLLGRDAVGHERGDQRAGAGPDVDVELVDRAVGGEQVERPQGADLVDAAGESAASQDQRGARGAPLATCRRVHLDHVAHEGQSKVRATSARRMG